MKHCCNEMNSFTENPRDPIKYHLVFRTYYIDYNASNIITMKHCPWCGTKLPKELTDEFFDILEEEYQIETDMGEYKDIELPKEFQTDEWWKKRGL